MTFNKLVDKIFRDKQGIVTIGQSPNLVLISFLLFTILAMIFRRGDSGYLCKALVFGSIFTWSYLEIFDGANYFRRILGIVIMILSLMSAVTYLHILKT
jgi:hypothetical protein